MGRHEVGHIDNSMKIPLNNGVGCRFEGQFSINKVPGNFHVSTHSATAQPQNPDMTHIIHKLSFGDTLQVQNVHGAFNALGGADRLNSNPLASHDYILKIVPTVYEDKNGKQRYSYQYTVANKEYVAYSHTGRIIPAIWFRYDLSPITVKYTERRQPLYRFITTMMLAMCCTISAEAQRMQRRIQGHPEKKTLSTEAGWLPSFRSHSLSLLLWVSVCIGPKQKVAAREGQQGGAAFSTNQRLT
ncbi:endoplasmic reticulum-Golgi intermediate compartment protein 1 isoform X2 [Marmota monax]|uniref:endoplasmic reticulum-Golgi intermediate compartment protein 1 isoform X2 n=1 Tax=Marmota monax TaxID=9995 RepID=UPI0026F16AC4|nr:endoplasmic reticulum-Golgi intermediate compartment protein 1 isoform X2 [Marmota monax]